MRKNKFVVQMLIIFAGLIALLICTGKILTIFQTILNGNSIDLRNRIVGTRVALLHQDPYQYIWSTNDDIKLLDPLNHPRAHNSRLTVTPSLLLVNIPLTLLPFSNSAYLWFFIQWILFIGVFFMLIKVFATVTLSNFLLIGLLFILSPIWPLHLALGQTYIVYAFLFTLSLYFIHSKKNTHAYIILGLLIALRPTYFLVLPFLLYQSYWKRTLSIIFLTIIFVVSLTCIFFNKNIWSQYFHGMISLSNIPMNIETRDFNPQFEYPTIIEGWQSPIKAQGFSPEYENSLKGILSKNNIRFSSNILFIVIAIFVFTIQLYFVYKSLTRSLKYLLLMGGLTSIICEYLIPARRYFYADIQWIAIAPFLFISLKEKLQTFLLKIK